MTVLISEIRYLRHTALPDLEDCKNEVCQIIDHFLFPLVRGRTLVGRSKAVCMKEKGGLLKADHMAYVEKRGTY